MKLKIKYKMKAKFFLYCEKPRILSIYEEETIRTPAPSAGHATPNRLKPALAA